MGSAHKSRTRPEGMVVPGKLCEQCSKLRWLQLAQAPLHCCHSACLKRQALYNALQLCSIRRLLHSRPASASQQPSLGCDSQALYIQSMWLPRSKNNALLAV